LNTFFTEDQAIAGTFGLNAINFLSTFVTVFTVDKYGRVKLLVYGGILMMFSLIANAILSSMDQTLVVGACVITFAAMFIIGFAFSWGPVVWTVSLKSVLFCVGCTPYSILSFSLLAGLL